MNEFEDFWDLYHPEPQYSNRRAATQLEWDKCSAAKRQAILDWLQKKRPPQGRNPYFFVQDFTVRKQILSYEQYYERYKTTEERDGWRMVNPTGNKVIYVKT